MKKNIGALLVIAAIALGAPPSTFAGAASPLSNGGVVSRHDSVVYTVTFMGGEPAAVEVIGDGDTDLDVYVSDENDNLIASAEGRGDHAVVRWQPRWTGPFTIRIVNRGSVSNRYVVITN
jgi:hypothetical protein